MTVKTYPGALAPWSQFFQLEGNEYGLDPDLLAAICARESGGGVYLTPKSPAGTGDNGHGRGLMQIDDRTWKDFCASTDWKDPRMNIAMGAYVLRQALDALDGNEPAAIAAYNAGIGAARKILTAAAKAGQTVTQTTKMLDSITTGRDYVSWVLAKRQLFAALP